MSRTAEQGLTPRELEVARLVRDGLTDRDIAVTLDIARRTAEWHVQQIFNKLGFNTRAQIAAWTARDELVGTAAHSTDTRRHNLPLQLTTFVGRAQELATVQRLLATRRLVVLVGVAGAGKTRLALEVARQTGDTYADGIWLVDLTPIRDGGLVPRAFASSLRLHDRPRQPIAQTLLEDLRGRRLLLVIDNCEHLIDDCARLIDAILRSCDGITVLATSREPLRVSGEAIWRVAPLALPSPAALTDVDQLARCGAVQLFVDRAQLVAPGFQLSARNAAAVGNLCSRLEGLPLAIELAAARASSMAPEQMLARLQDRFALLTAGSRSGPARHRTLHAALDWSHDLLSDPEQRLFRRLSVFAGSVSLEATEHVCSANDLEVAVIPGLLGNLVDKSVVIAAGEAGEPTRFRMLETMREYGWKHLEDSGEVERVSRRHGEFFVALAEEGWAKLRSAQQPIWHRRLADDLSNLRSAFRWSRGRDPEAALRLAWALNDFCIIHGIVREGDDWFEQALAGYTVRDELRAKALGEGGWIAWHCDDIGSSAARWRESFEIYRELRHVSGIGQALHQLGHLLWWQGDFATARKNYEEGLAMSRQAGDAFWIAGSLRSLGELDLWEGDPVRARVHLEESLAWNKRVGEPKWRSYTIEALALSEIELGDFAVARTHLEEALGIVRELNFALGLVGVLKTFVVLAAAQSQPVRALRLAGACDSLSESIALNPLGHWPMMQRWLEISRMELGPERAAACLAEGRAMTRESAIEYALAG
ncbi:MAG: tetratricopeptide repeat protein [Chloroflexi bacterium]|nr:MAG: tetratricopeptide repeat protein [Chloroflexota bacterium]